MSEHEHAVLTSMVRSGRTEHRMVLRARIVLAAAHGAANATIAAETGLHVDTVRKWRRRFCQHRLPGLNDLRRSGRPPQFTPVQVAEVKQLACTLPAETGIALSRWSVHDLTTEAIRRGIATKVSTSTIGRWLRRDAIKPWQHQSWIFPRDPDFATKAGRVLDLYDRCWQGQPLGEDEYVISADEKSQLQALQRTHPGLATGPSRPQRVEFEYIRRGTLAYLAAYDVHHAHVFGQTAARPGPNPSPTSSSTS